MTADERLARLEAYARPPVMTRQEAWRYVDENTPLDVQRVIKELLKIQEAWLHYASLVDLDETEDMQDVG